MRIEPSPPPAFPPFFPPPASPPLLPLRGERKTEYQVMEKEEAECNFGYSLVAVLYVGIILIYGEYLFYLQVTPPPPHQGLRD